MSPKLAPQNVASMVKLFVIPIWRHMTTRAVDSLHLRTRNLQPLNENLSGAWKRKKNIFLLSGARFSKVPLTWKFKFKE